MGLLYFLFCFACFLGFLDLEFFILTFFLRMFRSINSVFDASLQPLLDLGTFLIIHPMVYLKMLRFSTDSWHLSF